MPPYHIYVVLRRELHSFGDQRAPELGGSDRPHDAVGHNRGPDQDRAVGGDELRPFVVRRKPYPIPDVVRPYQRHRRRVGLPPEGRLVLIPGDGAGHRLVTQVEQGAPAIKGSLHLSRVFRENGPPETVAPTLPYKHMAARVFAPFPQDQQLNRGLGMVEHRLVAIDFQKFHRRMLNQKLAQSLKIGPIVHRRRYYVGQPPAGPQRLQTDLEEQGENIDAAGNDPCEIGACLTRRVELKIGGVAYHQIEGLPPVGFQGRALPEMRRRRVLGGDRQNRRVHIPPVQLRLRTAGMDGTEELAGARSRIQHPHAREKAATIQEPLPQQRRGHILAEALAMLHRSGRQPSLRMRRQAVGMIPFHSRHRVGDAPSRISPACDRNRQAGPGLRSKASPYPHCRYVRRRRFPLVSYLARTGHYG